MTDTIYWAVKLDSKSVASLLSSFPPIHPNIYAEHVTIIYKPTNKQDELMEKVLGKEVNLQTTAFVHNSRGQAVVVSGVERINPGVPHITISCAPGVSPVYSNILIKEGREVPIIGPNLKGVFAKYTKKGWVYG